MLIAHMKYKNCMVWNRWCGINTKGDVYSYGIFVL
jgi:hypothetical protein